MRPAARCKVVSGEKMTLAPSPHETTDPVNIRSRTSGRVMTARTDKEVAAAAGLSSTRGAEDVMPSILRSR